MSGNKARHTTPQNKLRSPCRIHSRAVRVQTRNLISVLCRPGGHSEGILPDPIPNSAVKAFCVNGTAAKAAGEQSAARSAKDRSQPFVRIRARERPATTIQNKPRRAPGGAFFFA